MIIAPVTIAQHTVTTQVTRDGVPVTASVQSTTKDITAVVTATDLVVNAEVLQTEALATPNVEITRNNLLVTAQVSLNPQVITAQISTAGSDTGNDADEVIVIMGEDVGGGRVVKVFNGTAFYADPDQDYNCVLAFSRHATSLGEGTPVLLQGAVSDPAWSFSEGPIWAAANGLMTQIEPTGTSLIIGWALSSTSFFFKPRIAIVRQ